MDNIDRIAGRIIDNASRRTAMPNDEHGVKMYHGTTTGKLPIIIEEGRLAGPVYLSDTPGNAQLYADMAAEDEGERTILLIVHLPPDAVAMLKEDPEPLGAHSGEYILERDVPLTWIPWYPDPDDLPDDDDDLEP